MAVLPVQQRVLCPVGSKYLTDDWYGCMYKTASMIERTRTAEYRPPSRPYHRVEERTQVHRLDLESPCIIDANQNRAKRAIRDEWSLV